MMNKKEFHLLNYDPVELDRQIALRRELYQKMVGQLYKSAVGDEIIELLAIKRNK